VVGPGKIGYHHDEESRRLLHRGPVHGLLRIGGKHLDIPAERVLHHEAVQRLVSVTADLDPETLLALVSGELVGRRSDHLQGPLAYQANFVALIAKR
jgi:hypothetical protein